MNQWGRVLHAKKLEDNPKNLKKDTNTNTNTKWISEAVANSG